MANWETIIIFDNEGSETVINGNDYVDAINNATKYLHRPHIESISIYKDGFYYESII